MARMTLARRPADVRTDRDWMLLADDVYQDGGYLECDISSQFPPKLVAAEAIAHLAMSTALTQRLLAERSDWIALALAHGAAVEDVAASMDMTVEQMRAFVSAAVFGDDEGGR